jgi:FixJ family two-component response regulator
MTLLANGEEHDIKCCGRNEKGMFKRDGFLSSKEANEDRIARIQLWIAEDDEELREVLGDFLSRGDREIRLFESGQKVLEAIGDASFDVLVTDLMMPGADGIQVLHEVKRLHPESIVIIMTGYASLDSAIQAIRGGAYDYIQKPFKLDEMEIAVHNACEKLALMRENRGLLQRLKETTEEVSRLQGIWDEHLTHLTGICWVNSDDEKNEEMELVLHQINPLPPDEGRKDKRIEEKALEGLGRLIQFRREGFLSEEEFFLLKERFFQNLDRLR